MYLKLWILCCLCFLPQLVNAADPQEKPLKVGVLDIDKVLHESLVGIFIQKQVDQKRSELQKEIEGHETSLREDDKKLRELQNKEGTTADQLRTEETLFKGKV